MWIFGPPNVEKLKAKSDVNSLIKALNYPKDDSVRSAAAKALGEIKATLAVEPLIAVLKDKSGLVRQSAALALGQIGDSRAVEPLITVLKDIFLLRPAAKALGQIGDTRAVEPLIAALKNSDKFARSAVVESLGRIGDTRAIRPLVAALMDSSELVSETAVEALVRIGLPAVKPLVEALYDSREDVHKIVAGVLVKIGPSTIDPLITAMDNSYPWIRKTAAETLDRLGWQPETDELRITYWIAKRQWSKCVEIGASAVIALIPKLHDIDWNVSRETALALGQIGDSRAVMPLVIALKHNNEFVRSAAAKALGEIGNADAVTPLITALNDASASVRQSAAQALGHIGDTRAVEPLIAALNNSDKFARSAAVESLGQIGDARAVEVIIAAVKDSDENVRNTAINVLDQLNWQPWNNDDDEVSGIYWVTKSEWNKCIEIGAPAVTPLIGKLDQIGSDSINAAQSLIEIGAPAVEPLIAKLKHGEQAGRALAAYALGQIGDIRAVEPLIEALNLNLTATSIPTRGATARALGQIGDARAVEPLIAALIDALKNYDQNTATVATEALVKIGAPAVNPLIAAIRNGNKIVNVLEQISDVGAIEPLVMALKDDNRDICQAAVKALERIGDARSIEPLVAALKDGNSNTREAAAEVLGCLGWQPSNDEIGAKYWIAKSRFDKCVEIGSLAIVPLAQAVAGGNKPTSRAAAQALGQIGDVSALEPLINILNDGNCLARIYAVEALDLLGWQPSKDEIGAKYWIAKSRYDQCAEIGSPAVPLLVAALKNASYDDQSSIADTLVKIGAPSIHPLFNIIPGSRLERETGRLALRILERIYHNGSLDSENKTLILSRQHYQGYAIHTDLGFRQPSPTCGQHEDAHTDTYDHLNL